jgi:hypothetical protein
MRIRTEKDISNVKKEEPRSKYLGVHCPIQSRVSVNQRLDEGVHTAVDIVGLNSDDFLRSWGEANGNEKRTRWEAQVSYYAVMSSSKNALIFAPFWA